MSAPAERGPGPDPFGAARPPRRALVGFDGFIDSLYRPIRDHSGGVRNPYRDIPEFGREVLSRAGRSGGFELARQSVRLGGNAPLMALGLGALGVSTACVGALGLPDPDPAFGPLRAEGCELLSVAPAAQTWALEFDDGKLMLNDSRAFEGLGWDAVAGALGTGRARELLEAADLVAMVGWANMPLATELWAGLLERALPGLKPGARRFFVDLADISRAGAPELRALAGLLRRYRDLGPVALGLNENEALKLAPCLGLEPPAAEAGSEGMAGLTRDLRARLDLDLVVVHPRRGAWVADAGGVSRTQGRLVAKPVLSTGAGDHFNAGFCLGWLHGFSPAAAADLACRVSAWYVEHGRSPRPADLGAEPVPDKGA